MVAKRWSGDSKPDLVLRSRPWMISLTSSSTMLAWCIRSGSCTLRKSSIISFPIRENTLNEFSRRILKMPLYTIGGVVRVHERVSLGKKKKHTAHVVVFIAWARLFRALGCCRDRALAFHPVDGPASANERMGACVVGVVELGAAVLGETEANAAWMS